MKKPGFWMGLGVGVVLTFPLIALFYLGYQIAGLPFTPFVPLEWSARTLPGPLVTFGVDTMVSVLRAAGLGVADSAKLAEQTISVLMLLALGGVAGGLYFYARKRLTQTTDSAWPGVAVGGAIGLLLALMQVSLPGGEGDDMMLTTIWTVSLYALWGLALGYAASRLTAPVTTQDATVEGVDRRRFLIQMGGAAAAITVTGAGVGALLSPRLPASESAAVPAATLPPEQLAALPNSGDAVTPAPGTRAEITPVEQHYRIDINMLPPVVAAEGYTLPFTSAIGGESATLKAYTLDELTNSFTTIDAYITMSCISNYVGGDLIGTTLWTGIPMQDILADVGIPEGATHLKMTAADGFDETVALDLIAADRRVMLCYAWEGQPLAVEHGFPLRIHIPNHYGMKQPKWITGFEFLAGDQEGYWVRRGWDKQALVRSTSVIDTVAVESPVTSGDQTLIPIGGIAWAGDRGISKVEVQVDGGEWVEAQLRAPLSDRTWTIWRYDWPFSEGQHIFTVRATDGDGVPQIEAMNNPHPSGATGYHSVNRAV